MRESCLLELQKSLFPPPLTHERGFHFVKCYIDRSERLECSPRSRPKGLTGFPLDEDEQSEDETPDELAIFLGPPQTSKKVLSVAQKLHHLCSMQFCPISVANYPESLSVRSLLKNRPLSKGERVSDRNGLGM